MGPSFRFDKIVQRLQELRWARRPAGWAPAVPFLLAATVLSLICLASFPSRIFDAAHSTVLLDRTGDLLGASVAEDGQWRFPSIQSLPEKYRIALVQFEDQRFYQHYGVDLPALARALVTNLTRGRIVSGGSTISMQLSRIERKNPDRNFLEKLVEAFSAMQIELRLSKNQILQLFASNAPFGGNIVGIEAASWRYFNRPPAKLSWAESCLLAILPNSPGVMNPGKNRELLLNKRNLLLRKLRSKGFLDGETLSVSLLEPLPDAPIALPQRAPHLLALSNAQQPGRRVEASLDGNLQDNANTLLARFYESASGNRIHNAAILILDIDTGKVLAYAGNVPNADKKEHGFFNDMIQAPRSTGSTLKPFLYASMLDSGELLPTQLIADIPTRIGGFTPQNYSQTYSGAIAAKDALARSLNVPTVRALRSFGVDRLYGNLKKLGMTTLDRPAADYGLTLVLGGAEGTLWDLTAMYAGMARTAKGVSWKSPYRGDSPFFSPVFEKKAQPVAFYEGKMSTGAAWLTLEALTELIRPDEEGSWKNFPSSRKIAWKTGTSFGFRDAWAIGVTPQYAVGIWVGNADGEGRPNIRGFSVAAPLLFDAFHLLPNTGWFPFPEADLRPLTVCADSGFKAGPFCERTQKIWVPSNAPESDQCPYCRIVHLDASGQFQVDTRTENVWSIRNEKRFVLPPTLEYYYRPHHFEYKPLPPFKDGTLSPEAGKIPFSLIFPEEGSQIYIPIELDGTPGKVIFQATHRKARSELFWHLDDEYLGSTLGNHKVEVRPGAGQHVLTVTDQDGSTLTRTFQVLSKK